MTTVQALSGRPLALRCRVFGLGLATLFVLAGGSPVVADDPVPVPILVLLPADPRPFEPALKSFEETLSRRGVRPQLTRLPMADLKTAAELLGRKGPAGFDLVLVVGPAASAAVAGVATAPVIALCARSGPALRSRLDVFETSSKGLLAFHPTEVSITALLRRLRRDWPDLRQLGLVYSSRQVPVLRQQVSVVRGAAYGRGLKVVEVMVENPGLARQELELSVRRARLELKVADPAGHRSLFWILGGAVLGGELDTVLEQAAGVPVLITPAGVAGEGARLGLLPLALSLDRPASWTARFALGLVNRGTGRGRQLVAGRGAVTDFLRLVQAIAGASESRSLWISDGASGGEPRAAVFGLRGSIGRVDDGLQVAECPPPRS